MAQRRPHLTVNQASHTEVRVLPGAPYVLVAQWIARVVPNHEVGRSNRPEDTARDSPGERRSAKPPDGFDPRRVSTARRPRDQGSGVLNRQCAFESRRAGGGVHVYGTTEYSFPVRIWLVLRNQSQKLTKRVQVPFPAGAFDLGKESRLLAVPGAQVGGTSPVKRRILVRIQSSASAGVAQW